MPSSESTQHVSQTFEGGRVAEQREWVGGLFILCVLYPCAGTRAGIFAGTGAGIRAGAGAET